jgi:hypothetical protein
MLESLVHRIDQFDDSPESARENAEKIAETLNERKKALKEASADDFAVIIYDGRTHHRKLPVKNETDIKMSKEALDNRRDQLPDEVVKTAEYYIDRASREKMSKTAYEEAPEKQATNVVYIGEIDKRAWNKKQSDVEGDEEVMKMGGMEYPLNTSSHVKRAVSLFESGAASAEPMERAKTAQKIARRADELNVDVESAEVNRYDRESLPVNFNNYVSYRKRRAPEKLASYYDELEKKAESVSLLKTASLLRKLDKAAGFEPMEGEKIAKSQRISPSAFDVVFPEDEPPVKEASNNIEKVAEVFGDDFAEDYKNNPDEASSRLTGAEQKILRNIVQ